MRAVHLLYIYLSLAKKMSNSINRHLAERDSAREVSGAHGTAEPEVILNTHGGSSADVGPQSLLKFKLCKGANKFLLRNDLLIAVLFFITYKLFAFPLFIDPDVAWHIKAGDLILNTSTIPKYDIWSYASHSQEWYNISWVWDIWASLMHSALGLNNLHTLNCLLYGLLLVILYNSLSVWVKGSGDTKLVITSLSGIVLWDFVLFRPQIVANYLVLALNVLLSLYKRTSNSKFLLYIPFLMAIWANTHGSFILGLAVIVVYLLEALYLKLFNQAKCLSMVLLCSLLMTFINPYGFKIYYAVLRTLNSEIYAHIMEWGQFTFGRLYGSSLILCLFLVLSLLPKGSDKTEPVDRVLAFSCLFASLLSIRYFTILAILGAPYLACVIRDYIEQNEGKDIAIFKAVRSISASVGIIFSLYLILYGDSKLLITEERIPISEIEYIKQHYPKYRIFNNYGTGGYIIYYAEGKFRHFIDGRAGTAFSEEVIIDYLKFKNLTPGWQKIFDKYPTDGALISHHELKFLEIYDFFQRWEEVYTGKYGKIFINPSAFR